MTHTDSTQKRIAWHISALCAGFIPLIVAAVLLGAKLDTPRIDGDQTDASWKIPSADRPAPYSFPQFAPSDSAVARIMNPSANSAGRAAIGATTLGADKPATGRSIERVSVAALFGHHIYDVFDQSLFGTVFLGLPDSLSYGDPAETLPLISATAVMTLAHPERTDTAFTVVLDPGHGGSDPGTIGIGGLLEKELTLEIADRVRSLLLPHPNITIKLTRDNDRGFSRSNRVKHIRAAQGDLLVSLHLNNIPQRDLTVVETFYADRENILESEMERRAESNSTGLHSHNSRKLIKTNASSIENYAYTHKSRRIANILQKNIFDQVSSDNPKAINAGVKKETLYTLTRSEMPGTLIELTCLSNKTEEQRLKSASYRQKIAESIAEGLLEYFSTPTTTEIGTVEGI